ncbi:hypothetical protein ACH47B_36805 [Rhodococcus sp. NPDC019627]|uniref:hypothetical protein n=1 Tax=unclassified Rhodococcus (in: high G+C Gram-positive bacteria) TaxID=192944 RepID=UPI00340A07CD
MNFTSSLLRHHQAPTALLVVMIACFGLLFSGDGSLMATAIITGIYVLIALPLGLLFGHGGLLSVAQAS